MKRRNRRARLRGQHRFQQTAGAREHGCYFVLRHGALAQKNAHFCIAAQGQQL